MSGLDGLWRREISAAGERVGGGGWGGVVRGCGVVVAREGGREMNQVRRYVGRSGV